MTYEDSCFSEYILVEGYCGDATPSTGLYLNRALEGISLQGAANIASGEVTRGVDLLNRCIENGIRRARRDVVKQVMDYVAFDVIKESQTYGCFKDDYLTEKDEERGVKVSLECSNNCRYLRPYINSLTVKANTTITDKQIKIIDGGTTTTYTVDLSAGVATTKYIGYKCLTNEVQIVWDTSDIKVNNSNLSCSTCGSWSNIHEDCGTSCNDCGCDYLDAIGSDGTSNTYGITVFAEAICDEDAFTCDIKDWLREAALYASGIEFVLAYKTARRINAFTLYQEDEYNELRATWEDRYNDEIKTLSKKLPKYLSQLDDCCIKCNSDRWAYQTP